MARRRYYIPMRFPDTLNGIEQYVSMFTFKISLFEPVPRFSILSTIKVHMTSQNYI